MKLFFKTTMLLSISIFIFNAVKLYSLTERSKVQEHVIFEPYKTEDVHSKEEAQRFYERTAKVANEREAAKKQKKRWWKK